MPTCTFNSRFQRACLSLNSAPLGKAERSSPGLPGTEGQGSGGSRWFPAHHHGQEQNYHLVSTPVSQGPVSMPPLVWTRRVMPHSQEKGKSPLWDGCPSRPGHGAALPAASSLFVGIASICIQLLIHCNSQDTLQQQAHQLVILYILSIHFLFCHSTMSLLIPLVWSPGPL